MQALWMLLASFAFACMGVCIKLSLGKFSIGEIVFFRSTLGWVLMQGFVALRGLDLRTPYFKAQVGRAAVGLIGMTTFFAAISLLPLATAITLQYTAPLFMGLVLAFWFHEPIPPRAALMLILGFVGIILLLQPTLGRDDWIGAAVGLGAGVLATLALLNVRRLGQLGEPEWRTVYYFSAIGSLVGVVWVAVSGGFHAMNVRDTALLLGVGGFGTIGQVAMTTALKHGKALLVANLSYATVVFGSIFGLLLWGESMPAVAWTGMALIVASGMVMTALSRTAPAEAD